MITDLNDIDESFKEFYSELYTSKSLATREAFLIHSTF